MVAVVAEPTAVADTGKALRLPIHLRSMKERRSGCRVFSLQPLFLLIESARYPSFFSASLVAS